MQIQLIAAFRAVLMVSVGLFMIWGIFALPLWFTFVSMAVMAFLWRLKDRVL